MEKLGLGKEERTFAVPVQQEVEDHLKFNFERRQSVVPYHLQVSQFNTIHRVKA